MLKQILSIYIFLSCGFVAFSQPLSPTIDSIPMSDGKKLAVDIYKPNNCTQCPTILIQTPYNRIYYRWSLPLGIGVDLDSSDYNFAIVDWRGFYGSAAAATANPDRGQDGYDAVQWIAAQSWSDGQIGTWGPSALGKIQYQTAQKQPPNLVCGVPVVAGSQFDYHGYYPGGVYRTEYVEQLDALGYGLSTLLKANPFYNFTWQFLENQAYYPASIAVPMLMIGGWYDHAPVYMLDLFAGLQTSSPITVRNQHKIWIGPWVHGGNGAANPGTATQGELTYPNAGGISDSIALAFFDYHLLGTSNNWNSTAPITYYQMGNNQWETTNTWPPANLSDQTWYLHSGGLLDTAQSTSGNASFSYDPADPSPTHGGTTLRADQVQGPYDQRDSVEARSDHSIFSTSTLTDDLIVKGKIKIHLFISSDRLDTDIAVRLTDVYPDGRSMLLTDDIQRMRFRNGYSTSDTASIVPGTVYPITIELADLAHTFLAGHQIRLIVTGSNYPKYDNNLNNGGAVLVGGDTLVATNTIYHNTSRPSRIVLPTMANPILNTFQANTLTSEQVYLSPNPCQNQVQLHYDNILSTNSITYSICDINGRTIKTKNNYITAPFIIDTQELSAGIFFITFKINDRIYKTKLVKIP
ncbi:MAG: CocE/NonD family hydrolase [Aureispira sp.]|nr:CocE/NonD family hydrolase [Aureispira sp.]